MAKAVALTRCRRASWRIGCLLWLSAWAAGAAPPELLNLPTPRGVQQQALVEEAAAAKAVVLLFAGADGGLRFSPGGEPARLKGNFLIRSRELFRKHGLTTVSVGTPSDRRSPPFLDDPFRVSAAHAQDVAALIAEVRRRYGKPVWLIGTSRGTVSAAAIALHLGAADKGGPDGIVLTSSMTDIADTGIDKMPVPTLLVAHSRDTCPATRGWEVRYIAKKLKAPRQQVLKFKGGRNEGHECEAFAYHGYNGIEDEVVAAIAAWIVGR